MKHPLGVLVAVALTAVACGGATDSASDSDDAITTAGEVCSGSTPAGSTSDPLPDDLPAGRGVVVAGEDGDRIVRTKWGDVTVPDAPERIVSVYGDIDLESMLALGVEPVAAGTQGGAVESGFAPHLEGVVADVEPLAWTNGPSIEAIAAQNPDLIFAPDAETAKLLDDLAPVVPSGTWDPTQWKEDFLYVGAVIGCADEAEDRLSEYEDRAAALREEIAPTIEAKTVASPQVSFDHAQIVVAGVDQHSSTVLTELGFTLAPIVEGGDPWEISLSHERLDDLDADILFWQVRQDDQGDPDTAGLQIAKDNPLWPSLPAVENDRVYEVPNRPWYFPTILGAEQILEDVESSMGGEATG
jgi:iron complex transport system substrate-binding protein